jgi:hypothetical protein
VSLYDQTSKLVTSTAGRLVFKESDLADQSTVPLVSSAVPLNLLSTISPREEALAVASSSTALLTESIEEPFLSPPINPPETISPNSSQVERTWVYGALLGLFGLAFGALLITPRKPSQ